MFEIFKKQEFLPVVACTLAVFVLFMLRPSFLLNDNTHKTAPFCLNKWYTTLIVFAVGAATYYYVNKNVINLDILSF